MIIPAFFTDERVVECSTTARLLFVGMWCFCDDGGCHPASVRTLKMEVFPGDSFSVEEISAMVAELVRVELIETYHVDGKDFWHVTGWHNQKIEHPQYKYPRSKEYGERSTMRRRGLDECSTSARQQKKRIKRNELNEFNSKETNTVADATEAEDQDTAETIPPVLDTEAFRTAWSEWLAHKGRGYKLAGRRIQLNRLSELGVERAVSAIRFSIAQGWKGIFEESKNGNGREPKLRGLEGGTRVADTL